MTRAIEPDLLTLCDAAEIQSEAGIQFIYLRQLRFRVNGVVRVVDALLCPTSHSGYTTRLFLSQPVQEKAANWSVHQVLGRPWHTWSWQGVPANLPLPQMLLCHLDALK